MRVFVNSAEARQAGMRGGNKQQRADRRKDVIYALLYGRKLSVTALEQATGFPRAHINSLLHRLREAGLARRCGSVEYMGKRRVMREPLWERGYESPPPRLNRDAAAPRPPRRPQAGSGQIAGPVYYRGLAGFGGWRGLRG